MANRLALIIEDQEDIADIYSNALNLTGFESQIITDGKVALEQLPNLEPDIILLDMNLPHVSGHYLFKQLRTIPHLADVPVIICTANSVMATAMKPEISATDYILVKPVSIHQLNDLVHRIFNE
jgi:two-component system, OmpR family, alkaline phosphatase synthesis response regulator PhoP